MRLYAKFNEKMALSKTHQCRHCNENFKGDHGDHPLVSNLIMPTFIKDLSNPQYKIIWQNAGVEISEASKLVFIGYSLPAADFEMRQLLSRMTRKGAEIEVVDYYEDKLSEPVLNAEKVWETFFGNRDIVFRYDGAAEYINRYLT